eukprot:9602285-Ditylum_brightwellii.AAC.1
MEEREPISQKKLDKGNARWCSQKTILGFFLDGEERTVEPPQDKLQALLAKITALLAKQRVLL